MTSTPAALSLSSETGASVAWCDSLLRATARVSSYMLAEQTRNSWHRTHDRIVAGEIEGNAPYALAAWTAWSDRVESLLP